MVTTETASATEASAPPAGAEPPRQKSILGGVAWALFGLAVVAVVVFVSYHLQPPGHLSPRVANPAVHGAPRPVRPLFGDTHWLTKMQLGTVGAVTLVVVLIVVFWRRYPRHPILLCALACSAIVWMDPVMNWAPYAVYNPQLWHLPSEWPLVRLSPTIEPFVVLGYVTFYLGPFFVGIWILRRLQRRRPVGSFVWRHPLDQPGGARLHHRVRLRRLPRDLLRPRRAIHLLAGHTVRIGVHRARRTSSRCCGSRRSSRW